MSEFKREERYIVVKIKDLSTTQMNQLVSALDQNGIDTTECAVVEHDWPIYDETWENVQRLAEGRPSIRDERNGMNAKLVEIKDSLYGRGLQVHGWHLNGEAEPMDTWFEENDWEPEVES